MSDLPRTHWVGDGCVPPHSTEPAVLPPISDSTVTPVASEGTMRLRRERDEARAEVERLTDANERLAGMVEWSTEVIVDARDACQRAEQIEPMGSPDWVESGIAMRTTALREVRAILDRERNADPSRYDALRAEVERLTNDVTQWEADYKVQSRKVERLRAVVQAVRHLRDETELRNHNSALWQRLNGLIPVLDAALGGERDA